MKTILNGVLKLSVVCFITFTFQTCKKESELQPQAVKEDNALQISGQVSVGTSYIVSSLVSGVNSQNLPKVQSPFRICSATDGSLYVSSPNSGGLIYKISQRETLQGSPT
jgi:hypothetical protein